MSAISELKSQRHSCQARLYLIAARRYIVLLCQKLMLIFTIVIMSNWLAIKLCKGDRWVWQPTKCLTLVSQSAEALNETKKELVGGSGRRSRGEEQHIIMSIKVIWSSVISPWTSQRLSTVDCFDLQQPRGVFLKNHCHAIGLSQLILQRFNPCFHRRGVAIRASRSFATP